MLKLMSGLNFLPNHNGTLHQSKLLVGFEPAGENYTDGDLKTTPVKHAVLPIQPSH